MYVTPRNFPRGTKKPQTIVSVRISYLCSSLYRCNYRHSYNTQLELKSAENYESRKNEEMWPFYLEKKIKFCSEELWMRWVGHVARMAEERGCIGSWWGNRKEGDHWGDLGVDGWIILGWISRRWDVSLWTRLCWPRIETGGGRLWVR